MKNFLKISAWINLILWSEIEDSQMANSEDRHVQSKPKLLTSWSYKTKKKKEEFKKKMKGKGKNIKNTQTFTTWQFSLQAQYTHIIPVWLCSLS